MGKLSDAMVGDDLFVPLKKTPSQLVRRDDPDTSKQAAGFITTKIAPLQLEVLEHLRASGSFGLCDLELEERCGSHGSTFRTRRAELVEIGLVRDSGRTLFLNGRNRIVWVVT